ncbi:MAG TPA: hypothetical protein VN893_17645, partial [Bryobacteraceae bacterium]|nr:hypothetical protein [Bryobacteraceae bacterium]
WLWGRGLRRLGRGFVLGSAAVTAFAVMAFGVVVDVEATALKLEGRRRNEPVHYTTARLVLFEGLIGKALENLEGLAAKTALVFVKRHDFLRTLVA